MKKILLCGIALVAGLMSCTEDYNDWASPQSNAAGEQNPPLEMNNPVVHYKLARRSGRVLQC